MGLGWIIVLAILAVLFIAGLAYGFRNHPQVLLGLLAGLAIAFGARKLGDEFRDLKAKYGGLA